MLACFVHQYSDTAIITDAISLPSYDFLLVFYTEARSSVPVWWCNSWGVEIGTSRVAGSTPGLTLSGNNLGQVVHQAV